MNRNKQLESKIKIYIWEFLFLFMYIDVHAHLDICDIEKSVKACKEKNVMILTVGINKETNRKVLDLSKKYKNVELCLGIYPTETTKLSEREFNEELKFIEKNKDKIIGIAEIGLDLHEPNTNNPENFEIQKKRFISQVKLAIKLDKPIVVHSRKAEKETIEILKDLKIKKVIMHCFSGNFKLVKEIIESGWFFSIPANVKFSEHFQKVIEVTPIEQLFCETDSPFLHPDKNRRPGVKNSPENVIGSYNKIAEIKKISLKETEKKIEENYLRLFGKN
ncbi:hypothetical protein COV12_03755 [Candidatus Woesearchaeota archaeon CG10_big_fil_rev_8_21_14_0_10_32_24]|nr:MAG: hypothetical protein COV12_03755 [Candidatus Woesearchaeota archaeon CG10_big_fil_rev_8_21_14_0_10_32_24]